jgi:hypothetical protein
MEYSQNNTHGMHSRNRLHKSKLGSFKAFCESKGWKEVPCKGGDFTCEVLRMVNQENPSLGLLLVHARNDAQHLTTWGNSERLCSQWMNAKYSNGKKHDNNNARA